MAPDFQALATQSSAVILLALDRLPENKRVSGVLRYWHKLRKGRQ
jgi:hypothetical protein